VPIPDVESATPNLDIVRRRAATGQAGPLRRYQAVMATDAPVSELEERATQELSAFELNPERQQYLDQYKKDLRTAYRAMRDKDNFDRGQALGRALGELQDDIEQIPSGSTGPFRDELVSMYQDYVTKNRLFKAGPESLAAEFDRDVALAADPETSSDTALERVRTEHEAVPPPNVAQTGQGIDRHLENVLSTMNAMSDRSRRLHPAEMSVAVQNMRGAPLAASYVQPRDAADPDYMAAVEHQLLRTRQLKRRGMRKSRRQ
jgi:hypothetical protein